MIGLISAGVKTGLNFIGLNKVKFAVAFIATIAISGFFLHYRGLIDDLGTYRENQTKLEEALKSQSVTLETFETAQEEFVQAQRDLENELRNMRRISEDARRETRQLQEFFASVDLNQLAASDPEGFERSVNNAISRTLCVLHNASGGNKDCSDGSTETENSNPASTVANRNPSP